VAKSRENRSRPSEEDRWQQSRRSAEEIQDSGLANSEVRKVRAQELGAPSREVAKSRGAKTTIGSRSREDRWIRNPIAYHRAFGGSEVERESLSTSEVAKCREPRHECGHVAEPQGGARVIDRWTRVTWRKESTLR
jgi:hypothetical protein